MLCVFGNEQREALVNATFLEESFKLLLEVKVEGVKLKGHTLSDNALVTRYMGRT
jgi:hypothetical protein